MYLVSFTNFAYTKAFNDKASAIAHMERVCLESVLMDSAGKILGGFSPINGLTLKKVIGIENPLLT